MLVVCNVGEEDGLAFDLQFEHLPDIEALDWAALSFPVPDLYAPDNGDVELPLAGQALLAPSMSEIRISKSKLTSPLVYAALFSP